MENISHRCLSVSSLESAGMELWNHCTINPDENLHSSVSRK